ncbi:hypothetical protein PR202_ga05657 [Eleusine coracana subsp. coracana]|uniref:Auxin response factor n=1 Tax=Eleusine coracana subsp. coracana TaxID=191504 RepID=A0AAV5BU11_ELECO|nr:hypothetical protein PR202_ga05203 [Eleusine coracana subsp. coracana]GJM89462.1 hypothetical protein PR202_ga05657 [Eleusine coracana subsp. coracana]
MGIVDLNAADGDTAAAGAVCAELWHACAGAGVALPRRGSAVVYLPQAHLAAGGSGDLPPVPAHVVCRVVDVQLCVSVGLLPAVQPLLLVIFAFSSAGILTRCGVFVQADVATDEVYARLALVAEGGLSAASNVCQMFGKGTNEIKTQGNNHEMEDTDGENKPQTPHMFCKTLTASDTSTHGGFSVPRRAAEDCFPPLDYEQLRPSQELIAKDLHGMAWSFRHIYRGQPRRHLLTTGWSSFINKKKLALGDAVLFLRGNDGELRLGVRRAVQLKNEALLQAVSSTDSKLRMLSAVRSSLDDRSIFHVCFNPRSSGLISDVSEVDPIRWPGSKWRCLVIQWDGHTNCNHKNRVSPWEIERIGGTVSVTHCLSSSSKRTKLCFPESDLDTSCIDGNGHLDSMATESFNRVLQGQELMRSRTNGVSCPHSPDIPKFQTSGRRRFSAEMRNGLFNDAEAGLRHRNSTESPYQPLGFSESVRFSEVLQGQEISRVVPLYHGNTSDACTHNDRVGSSAYVHRPAATRGYSLPQFTPSAADVCSPSSVFMFNQTMVPQPEFEGTINLKYAYGSRCAPLEQMQRKTEDRPFFQHQMSCQTERNQFDVAVSLPQMWVSLDQLAGKLGEALAGFSDFP